MEDEFDVSLEEEEEEEEGGSKKQLQSEGEGSRQVVDIFKGWSGKDEKQV